MKTFLALIFAGSAFAQVYHATAENASSLTIQQAAVGGKLAQMDTIWVQCPQADVVLLSRNGSAATKTAIPVLHVPTLPVPKFTAWSDSNVGIGTALQSLAVEAGQDRSFSLMEYKLTTEGRGINFTARTASGQKCKITISVRQ